MRPQRVFLVGYYGVHNTGDEAIRDAIEAAASELGVEITRFTSRSPSADPRAVSTGGVGIVGHVRAILAADRVVLGGGGILKDEGLRLPLELFATSLVARLLGRTVALASVGVGPFYSRLGRALVSATARLASVRTVRDEDSREHLHRLGVRSVVLGADPTFALGSAGMPLAHGRDPGDELRVVVSIRPWFLRDAAREQRQAALREAIATAVASLSDAGWKAVCVSLYWPRDQVEAQSLVTDAGLREASVLDHELSWQELLAEVARADLVIAMRYHAVVAASLLGRPVIALAYEPKVEALARELGIPMVRVDGPAVATHLSEAVLEFLRGPASATPDAATLELLRARSWRALRLALGAGSSAGGGEGRSGTTVSL